MGRVCNTHGRHDKCIQTFGQTPERERPLVKHRERYNNINVDITEIGSVDMDWIHLAQDRVQCLVLTKIVMNFRFL
jgi:hypothetical protein